MKEKTARWVALTTWLLLLAVSFLTAPPADPNQNELTLKVLTFQLEGLNLSLVALFNLMGVWPMVFMAMLAFDTTEQRVWRWPFVLGAFVLGAFALLPYLVFRRWGAPKRAADSRWLRLLGSRGTALVLTVLGAGLVVLFFAGGDLGAFVSLCRTNQFAYVMSFDFIACTIAGVLLSLEDASARPASPTWAWSLASSVGTSARLMLAPLAQAGQRR